MYKDIEVGTITYDQELDKFEFELNENILYWIEDRVMPPNRDGIEYLLDKMGLNFYDAWAICKANKGMSLEDYWWLNSGEDEYEKGHIRYLIESGKQTYFGRPV